MGHLSKEDILKTLENVRDPQSGKNIVARKMVSGLQINDKGDVVFMIEVDATRGAALEPMRLEAEEAVRALAGVKKVTAILTAERPQQAQAPAQNNTPDPHGMNKNPKLDLPIRYIIAVASGKGGVGKSTVSANIAVAMAQNGLSVGLLDADIYGPSQPRMMGLQGKKPKTNKENKIEPLKAHGVKVMSIGFMVDEKKALVWRGPMVQSALYQMLRDVNWGSAEKPLDVLIVDMPPGTGDAQLTMAQKVPLSGAVIVSTPQDIALIDARKGIEMFETVGVPVLGLIENMSTHICSNCGHEDHIFGHGGARKEAKKRNAPFLGEIPLQVDIRLNSDGGVPITASGHVKDSEIPFKDIAKSILSELKP